MMQFRLALALAAAVVLTGCLAMGTVQTADTLGKGHFQVSAEPGVYSLTQGGTSGTGGPSVCAGGVATCPYIAPHLDVSFRYGVKDRVDIGVRGGSSLIELQTKFLLTDPQGELLAMSLAPTVSGVFFGTSNSTVSFYDLAIPLLIGIKHLDGNEITLGPRINNILVTASSGGSTGAAYLFGVGGTIGYCLSIGEIFKILPEFAVNFPVAGTIPLNTYPGGLIWQFKVGLMFGRSGHKPAAPEYSPAPLPPPGPPPPVPPPDGPPPPPPPAT